MMEKKSSLTFFLILLFIVGTLPITNPVSADGEVDNWPENDAWLRIELISWSANDSVEWDNGGGLPDPIFKICVEADGDNLDCINTPTWENQLTLNNSWNYSMDIPDNSNILNITIECEDNDAFNDDECDMNSDVNYWRLYAEYNWSATPSLTISGDGDDDDDVTWKNAASTWKFSIDGYGDEDGDGVSDNVDLCPGTNPNENLLNNSSFIGCSWGQWDLDGDGVASSIDSSPFNSRIGLVSGGGRDFNEYGDDTLGITLTEFQQLEGQNYIDVANDVREIDIVPSQEYQFNNAAVSLIHTWTAEYNDGEDIICESTISSKEYFGDSSTFQLTEIMKLNYTMITTENSCAQERPGLLRDHIGTFGDFDGNGIPDLVHSVTDHDQGIYNRCEVYFGIPGEQISFHGPIIIGTWQTDISAERDMCSNGNDFDITGIISADIDNDGFDDIVTSRGVIFMSDNGFESSTKVWLGDEIAFVLDYDDDGDLDLIGECSPNNSDVCSGKIGYNLWIPDEDGDGVTDSEDSCSDTVEVTDIDSQGCGPSQRDSDYDNITDDIDLCPSTNPSLDVDASGCAEQQLDDDNDGINNAIDECPETPTGNLVNVRGCSFEDSQDLDSDNDGVLDSEDACPETEQGVTVDSLGCDVGGGQTMDVDSDGDGVYDRLDECPYTANGVVADFKGCPMDSDSDGIYDGLDECPSTDTGKEVDSTGCFSDSAGSDSDAGSAALGCFWMIAMIGLVVFVVRKVRGPKQQKMAYQQPMVVAAPVQRQSVPIPQISSRERELENQSRQAQIEAQRLRQELANQAQITQQLQMEAAQKQMSEAALAQKQHELAIAQQEKEQLEAKLAEAEKNTPIVQNITYNITDSAISGDITNKINRDD